MSQDMCQSEGVLKRIGVKGTCRTVIAPRKTERQGQCSGLFAASLPCTINYGSDNAGASLNIKCGTDPENSSVDQNMEAEISSYNVAALLTLESGKTAVMNDPNLYTTVSNQMIVITISEVEKKQEATIVINTQSGPQALSNVSCR